MGSKNINRHRNTDLIPMEDGVIVRLLPNIDKNSITQNPCISVTSAWNNKDKYYVGEDLDYPIMRDLHNSMNILRYDGQEIPFHMNTKYYMYCLDYNYDIKIFRFGKKIFDKITDKLSNPNSRNVLNPENGIAFRISRGEVEIGDGMPLPSYDGCSFINIEPLKLGDVRSYISENKNVSIEKLINRSSWYRGKHRREVINTLRELDPEKYEYLKKFSRRDVIDDLLNESS